MADVLLSSATEWVSERLPRMVIETRREHWPPVAALPPRLTRSHGGPQCGTDRMSPADGSAHARHREASEYLYLSAHPADSTVPVRRSPTASRPRNGNSSWLSAARRNVVAVALANKTARTISALLAHDRVPRIDTTHRRRDASSAPMLCRCAF